MLFRPLFFSQIHWLGSLWQALSQYRRAKKAGEQWKSGRAKNGRGREGESLEQATGCVKGELYSKFYAHFGEQKKNKQTNEVLIK